MSSSRYIVTRSLSEWLDQMPHRDERILQVMYEWKQAMRTLLADEREGTVLSSTDSEWTILHLLSPVQTAIADGNETEPPFPSIQYLWQSAFRHDLSRFGMPPAAVVSGLAQVFMRRPTVAVMGSRIEVPRIDVVADADPVPDVGAMDCQLSAPEPSCTMPADTLPETADNIDIAPEAW